MGNQAEVVKTQECEILEYTNFIDYKINQVFECQNQKILFTNVDMNIKNVIDTPIENFNNGLYTLHQLNSKFYYLERISYHPTQIKTEISKVSSSFNPHTYFEELLVIQTVNSLNIYNFKEKKLFQHHEQVIFSYGMTSKDKIWFITKDSIKLWTKGGVEKVLDFYINYGYYTQVFFKVLNNQKIFLQIAYENMITLYDIEKKESEIIDFYYWNVNLFETKDYFIFIIQKEITFFDKNFKLLKKKYGSYFTKLKNEKFCYYDLEMKGIVIWDPQSFNDHSNLIKIGSDIPLGLTQLYDGRILTFGMKNVCI